VLCVESVDLPDEQSVDTLRIDPASELAESDGVVTAAGGLIESEERVWPYPSTVDPAASARNIAIPLTPYHEWANRGPSTMRVWMPAVQADQIDSR
jgi:uncharacterized protein